MLKQFDLVQQRVKEHGEVKPFPLAVTRLLDEIRNPVATATSLATIIQCDPSLSVRVLRWANSPLYGLSREIRTIAHAAAFLGMQRLKNLSLSVAGAAMFAGDAKAVDAQKALWEHSLAVAITARTLAQKTIEIEPDEAFLAGIFHDMGKLLLFDALPEEYAEIHQQHWGDRLMHQERFAYGIGHDQIGMKLARAWGLSEQVAAAIGYHHRPTETPNHMPFVSVVHVADALAKQTGIGSRIVRCNMDEAAMIELNLEYTTLETVVGEAQTDYDEAQESWA